MLRPMLRPTLRSTRDASFSCPFNCRLNRASYLGIATTLAAWCRRAVLALLVLTPTGIAHAVTGIAHANTGTAQASAPAPSNLAEQIADTVAAALRQRLPDAEIRTTEPALHSYLRQRHCRQPAISLPPAGQTLNLTRISVQVRCQAPAWSFYVPVQVEVLAPALVTRALIPRDALIGADDITVQHVQLRALGGNTAFLTDAAAVRGMQAARTLRQGVPLKLRDLREPHMVSKGQRVALVAQRGSARIATQAVAMENGRRGDQIRVRNTKSERVVHAWVWQSGTVGTTPGGAG